MMRILSNQKIKILFTQIGICIVFFMLFMITVFLQTLTKAGERYELAFLQGEETAAAVRAVIMGEWRSALCIMLGAFLSGGAVIVFCWRYFKAQDGEVACAVVKIQELIAGNRDIRLTCDEEGELYRLFHEINSLAAILNAKAENEEKSKKFLQNTISDISHQLKTPLAALNIYNGIMQTEAETNDLETIREFTGLSEQELERIETLVQNLLKITKFDAGTIVMEKQQENVAELMAEVKKHFAFRAAQEGKEIVLSGSESLFFLCDRNWIMEAVSNLVKNALDHTESGNSVWIDWEQSVSAVRIRIRDDGCGIHTEDMHHIFKRFYRSRYSKDTQGIGLGLSLAKSVTEAHNGTIEVDSRLGEGTVFTMNLLTTKL